MELTEQERQLEKLTAEAHGSLSLGLLAHSLNADWGCIPLAALGAILALSSVYLAFIHRWKRKKILAIAANVRLKHVAWFLGFIGLGIGLTQQAWGFWWGILSIGTAYVILGSGIGMEVKRRKVMGTRGRKNVKKPKQQKERKEKKK